MSKWREPERKIPKPRDVVRDLEGRLGLVVSSNAFISSKTLTVTDENESEIYTNEPASQFTVVENHEAAEFHKKRYDLKGYRLGAICSYKNTEIPLEILQMDWNFIRNKMTFCLRDLREFKGEILKTEDLEVLKVFSPNYPPIEEIFSVHETGAQYRLQVSLVEKEAPGWSNCGSPWEFFKKEDALLEVERWKSQLQIRRLASVFSTHKKLQFPCWTVEAIFEDQFFCRVKKVEYPIGAPGYFETSLHAALAMKTLPLSVWQSAYYFSQDSIL